MSSKTVDLKLAQRANAEPCPPLTCVHVDCEVLNAVTTALEARS